MPVGNVKITTNDPEARLSGSVQQEVNRAPELSDAEVERIADRVIERLRTSGGFVDFGYARVGETPPPYQK